MFQKNTLKWLSLATFLAVLAPVRASEIEKSPSKESLRQKLPQLIVVKTKMGMKGEEESAQVTALQQRFAVTDETSAKRVAQRAEQQQNWQTVQVGQTHQVPQEVLHLFEQHESQNTFFRHHWRWYHPYYPDYGIYGYGSYPYYGYPTTTVYGYYYGGYTYPYAYYPYHFVSYPYVYYYYYNP